MRSLTGETATALDRGALEARLLRVPFHRWLGLHVLKIDDGEVTLEMTWREEMISHPERRYTHGGVLAALIDVAADYAIAAAVGRASPTVDILVDFHRPAAPGNLFARGRVLRLGSTLSVATAEVVDAEGRLVATGRGVFVAAPPP